jgi:hypothetical protein
VSGALTFRRRLDVRAWRVVGTIARPQRRNWEPAVLVLAKERGWVTPELVATELLDGRRPVARKLVAACLNFGLLAQDGELFRPTDDGLRAAETHEVLVPERGTWTLWAADDPLLGNPVIAVAPANDSRVRSVGGRGPVTFAEPLPDWIPDESGMLTFDLDGRAVRVIDLGEHRGGEPVPASSTSSLELVLDESRHALRLAWKGDGGHEATRDLAPPDIDETEIDAAVRQAISSQGWPSAEHPDLRDGAVSATGDLQISFAATSDTERSTRVRSVQWIDVATHTLGDFETVVLERVHLQPRTRADAEEWMRWRLLHAIQGFATTARYEAWSKEASAEFAEHGVVAPSRRALASTLAPSSESDAAPVRPAPAWWHLTAPCDWGL